MALLSLLARTRRAEGLVGVGVQPDGVSLAHVVLRQQATPDLLSCQFVPTADGQSAEQALGALTRPLKGTRTRVVNFLEPGTTSLSLVEAPEVNPSELRAAVRWRIKDMLDFHIDDAVIDVFDIPSQGDRGRSRMMYVVAARTAAVQRRIDLIEDCGLNLTAIDIPELAQRNIASVLPEDASGVALLHLTSNRGLLTLTQRGVLYLARTLEMGLDDLVQAGQSAEESELGFGAADGPSLAMQRLLDSIVLEVQRSLDYCESHFAVPPIGHLMIAPTPQPMPDVIGHLSANLGVKVQALDLNAVFNTNEALSDELQWRCFLTIGAALRHEQVAL